MSCEIGAVLVELDRLEEEVGPGYDDHYFAALQHVREYVARHLTSEIEGAAGPLAGRPPQGGNQPKAVTERPRHRHSSGAHDAESSRVGYWPPPRPVPGCDACWDESGFPEVLGER